MSFDSLTYAVFLPCVCLVHWLCPARHRWILLLIASYIFYGSWNIRLSLLIFIVTGCTWLAGLAMEKAERPPVRRCLLGFTVLFCLCVLGYFKYFNLLGNTFAMLTGGSWQIREIILPAGISFYTFQAMSYVIDIYRRKTVAEKHFGYYALYISFFPQLVAGPIERAVDLIPQLRQDRKFHPEDAAAGLRLILSGFFRKLAVADLIAPFVDAVFRSQAPDGSAVMAAAVLFGLQIYCDFSGYSEIAAGSARLLGIRLMRNFDRPYCARNIREFWRRWHISLTVWFTDYVYIPLGGSRKGLLRQLLASSAVFALCGLWHGADWSFLVWGLLHACLMALYTVRRHFLKKALPEPVERFLTLAAVSFAWIFFRAGSMPHALSLLHRLFSVWHPAAGAQLLLSAPVRTVSPAVLLFLLAVLLPAVRRLPALTYGESTDTSDMAWAGILLAAAMALLIRMDSGVSNAFIYFQF